MQRALQHIICVVLIVLFSCISGSSSAQSAHGIYDTIVVHGYIMANGDTIPFVNLPPVMVEKKLDRKQTRYWQEWTR